MPRRRPPLHEHAGRGLASRAARAFSATSIQRSHEYVEDSIKLVQVFPRSALAWVMGGQPYAVRIDAPADLPRVLHCGCTCPVADRREPCKHVYATLLVLDERGLSLGFEGERAEVIMTSVTGPVPRSFSAWDAAVDVTRFAGMMGGASVRDDDRDDDDRDDDDRDDDDRDHDDRDDDDRGGGTGVIWSDGGAPGWESRLHWLATPTPSSGRAVRPADLELHLRPIAGADDPRLPRELPDWLTVVPYRRVRRRDGRPGSTAPWSLRLDGSDPVDSAVEREALAALALGAPQAASAWPYLGRATHVRYDAVELRTGLVAQVLPALAATGRLGWDEPAGMHGAARFVPLTWDGELAHRLTVEVTATATGFALRASAVRGDERLPLSAITAVFGAGCVAVGERLLRLDHGADLARWAAVAGRTPLVVPRRGLDGLLALFTGSERMPALELAPDLGWVVRTTTPVPHLELRPGAAGGYVGQLRFGYGGVRRSPAAVTPLVLDAIERCLHTVDRDAEQRHLDALRPHLPAAPGRDGELRLSAGELAPLLPTLEQLGWQVWLEAQRLRGGGRLRATVSSGVDWFDVQLGGSLGSEALDGAALLQALRAGRDLVRLQDGSALLLPPEWRDEHGLLLEQGQVVDGQLRVPRSRAAILDLLLESLPEVELDAGFRRLRDRLAGFSGIAPARQPRGFVGTLRPYQKDGLAWLAFLRDLGFGGCLADDMGLGKTVQVLAAIVALRKAGERRPSLVVAPKSVVWNWLDEAARFAPGLKVFEHGGADRKKRVAALADADLVVTSYATLRLDAEDLAARDLAYVILDEAQAIKNPDSQVAKAARALRATHRLALTGTPVENHLGDLASIFEFLNPGMIAGVGALRRLGERDTGGAELAPLARALRPFLLRRTKAEVLPELPARSEQVIKVRLEGAQRRFYDELREGYRATLLRKVAREGMAGSTMHVLEALLRLRQAACAPALVAAARADDGSAKLDVLVEQLVELAAEGHKALVFSQFTSLLALVRDRLDAAGLVHEYLDGTTRDRRARVARFQDDPACQVFVISLKAGGTGLNLTAASYVFLLDPWWNPAVEAQAIDRSHRLGQTRAVTAYRLIAEDTVEDKILALQDHKRALLDGLFAEDAGKLSSLTADDLALLLAP